VLWSGLRCTVGVARNFVSCNQRMKVTNNRVLFKKRRKAELYLSREEKI
jgi:hypothetical protein